MAKRLFLAVLLAALAALAVWLAPGLLGTQLDSTSNELAASLAGPPVGGSVADFTPTTPARPAPAATFSDGEGRAASLSDFAGKLVLLNFWATWCGPCIEELPSLDRLQARIGDERFVVLALSIDRDGLAAIRPFHDKLAIRHLGLYLDGKGDVARAFNIKGLPTTVLIGPDGAILGWLQGQAVWDSPEALALIGFYRERLFAARSGT